MATTAQLGIEPGTSRFPGNCSTRLATWLGPTTTKSRSHSLDRGRERLGDLVGVERFDSRLGCVGQFFLSTFIALFLPSISK